MHFLCFTLRLAVEVLQLVGEERERRRNIFVHAHIYVLLAYFYRQQKVARNVFCQFEGKKKILECTVTVPLS